MNYYFQDSISEPVLKKYLERAVSAAFLVHSKTLGDDVRAIVNLGVKFLGRASGIWEPDSDDIEHFEKSRCLAEKVHQADPEIILQACLFEAVYFYENNFTIPSYVLEAFGLEKRERKFCVEDMLFLEKPEGFMFGEEGGIPDISRLETKLWFYYRATQYIEAGYEALHLGQIHLYCANDYGMLQMQELIRMIRDYAKKHARRGLVLLDAHSHGINIDGTLLLDYHAMPYTRVPLLETKEEKLVLVKEGYSEGGRNPNGWTAAAMPYLMEYDNWGGKVVRDFSALSYEERAYRDWFGYDQIGWFANQNKEDRQHFLEYTLKWTAIHNPNAFFQIPFRRTLNRAAISTEEGLQEYYQINTKGQDCPMGFGEEEFLKRIWGEERVLRERYANPPLIHRYGGEEEYDQETKMKLPERVIVYGGFQTQVGAVANDSNSEITRMYYMGDKKYRLAVVIPYKGRYDFAISTYGTLSATYCKDRFPRSGSSNKSYFETSKDNAVVVFHYQFLENIVEVEVV